MKKLSRLALLLTLATVLVCGVFACPTARAEATLNIEQYIMRRANDGLVEIPSNDAGALYPAVYDSQPIPTISVSIESFKVYKGGQLADMTIIPTTLELWDASSIRNALDKLVCVHNCSDAPVYFRTAVAIPEPEGFAASLVLLLRNEVDYTWTDFTPATIDGQKYQVTIATYVDAQGNPKALPGNAIAPPSLKQIALDKTVTNENLAAMMNTGFALNVRTEAFSDSAGLATTHQWLTTP